jgi:hypothetical protein
MAKSFFIFFELGSIKRSSKINCKLPKSQKKYSVILKPTNIQQNIIDIFSDKNY